MERAAAIKKLGKLLGKSLGYRVNDKASTAEERTEARAGLAMAIEVRNKLQKQRDERMRAVLAANQEYQALKAAAKEASTHVDKLSHIIHSHKFTVGVTNGMFFHVKAEGDSWEEVIRKVEAEQEERKRVA